MATKACPDCSRLIPHIDDPIEEEGAGREDIGFWYNGASVEILLCPFCAAEGHWLHLKPARDLPKKPHHLNFTDDRNCGTCGAPVRVAIGEVEPNAEGLRRYSVDIWCTATKPCAEISVEGTDLLQCIDEGRHSFSAAVPADAGPDTPKGGCSCQS